MNSLELIFDLIATNENIARRSRFEQGFRA